MNYKSILLIMPAVLLIGSIAYGQKSFSNEDLERYQSKSGSDQGEEQSQESPGSYDRDNSQTYDDRDSWCQLGEMARSDISAASSNVSAAQEQYDSVHGHYIRRDINPRVTIEEVEAARMRLSDAISAVDRAKKALEQLESEAQRKGVPPGWLKCNFK